MKTKTWLGLVAAGSLALSSSALFGQAMALTGKVVTVTSAMITMQTDKGVVWEIKRAADVTVTGELKVGATVTVNCTEPDAQKKEPPVN